MVLLADGAEDIGENDEVGRISRVGTRDCGPDDLEMQVLISGFRAPNTCTVSSWFIFFPRRSRIYQLLGAGGLLSLSAFSLSALAFAATFAACSFPICS